MAYDRLLNNPVLREDYRTYPPQRHERAAAKPKRTNISPDVKVQTLWTERFTLRWMAYRQKPPRYRDNAELPGLGKVNVGAFWHDCKCKGMFRRPPYDRLLGNPVLRADYCTHRTAVRGTRERRSDPDG